MKTVLIFTSTLFLILSCSISDAQSGKNNLQSNIIRKEVDYKKVELKVERGAFHYDTFILKYDSVVFIPKEGRMGGKADAKYYERSAKKISSKVFENYIDGLVEKGFLKMEDHYEERSTCTSGLTISLTLNGKTKKVSCTDFERGCPDLIYQIEKDLVEMHGKKLYRKFLPG